MTCSGRLMRERLAEWLDIADNRLRPKGVPLYLMLGNDDPPELAQLLDQAPWGVHAEGKVVQIDDEHEMISWGYANTTPWHTYREQDRGAAGRVPSPAWPTSCERPERAVFNLHPPPYDTQLDEAPALDENLRVQATLGQIQYTAGRQHRGARHRGRARSRWSACTATSTSPPASAAWASARA